MKVYYKKNKKFFWGAIIFILISNSFAIALQFVKGDVLDFAVSGEIVLAVRSALLLFVLIMSEVWFYFFYRQMSAKYSVGCTKYLKHDVFESILGKNYSDYIQCQQGEYVSQYTNDVDTIRGRYFEMLPLFWEILLKIILASVALFILDWRLALITLFLLTMPLYIPKLIEKRLQNALTEYLNAIENNLVKLNDWLAGFEIIKNYAIEKKIMQQFNSINNVSMERLLKEKQLEIVAQLITTLISYVSYFIVLIFSTWLVIRGEFSAGDFFVAIGMIDQLSYPLISLAEIIRQLVTVKPVCKEMEKKLRRQGNRECIEVEIVFNKDISFQNVCFSYGEEHPILNDLNVSIHKGDICLIQGPSGCGKTSMINLLLKYFDANKGAITIDDKNILDIENIYSVMTVVRQEAVLFRDTLRNNLTMYRDIHDSELIILLNRLGLHKFASIGALDSLISENGSNLSGGEKKRICLARALLRNTEILILDEPLANLDDTTVDKIEDFILSITEKTILVVSHQFSEKKLSEFSFVLKMS